MSDSLEKDAVETMKEELDQRFPGFAARYLRGADNLDGVIGVFFDLYASVPNVASPVFIFLAERLKGRGGLLETLGEFINTIPSTSRTLRAITGKTPESARADLIERWNNFKKNHRIGATMAAPAAATAAPATPTPPTVPAVSLSRVQQAVTKALAEGGFTEIQILLILVLFRIFRIEGGMNSDAVAEVEGEANSGKLGLLDTLKENAPDLKAMFSVLEAADLEGAWEHYNALRAVERDAGVTSSNRPEWRAAAAGIVRHLIPMIEFILMGHAERYPGSATAAAALDLIDKMNVFAHLPPSSAFLRVQNIKNTVRNTGFGLIGSFAVIIVCFLIIVQVTSGGADALGNFAWISTWVILGGAAAVTLIGAAIRKTWLALTGAFTIFAIAPVILTVVWVVAAVFTPIPDWRAFWMALIVVVGLDFITFGLPQKMIQTVGGIPSLFFSLFPNKEVAKEAADKVVKSSFLTSISSTIATAIVLLWAPVVFTYVFNTPVNIRVGSIGLIAVLACAHGYTKRGATMVDYTAYKDESFAKEAKAQALANFKIAYNGLKYSLFASLALYVAVWLFGTNSLLGAKDAMAHGATRTAEVVSDGGSRALDAAESYVDGSNKTGGGTSGSKPAGTVEANQPKTMTKAQKAAAIAQYCRENPIDQSSTCKK